VTQLAQPLAGIRVVDLTRVMSGPYCTMMLGDMGADVLKIERPGVGDDTRRWRPPSIGTESAYYLSVNRNKRSVAVDLKQPAGVEIVRRLVRGAAVVVENFSPGTAASLGVGYDELGVDRPDLVYCSISGFGQRGPERTRTAYDLIVQGMSGVMSLTGPPDGEPYRLGVPIADIAAGMFSAYAIVCALLARERTGRGLFIDSSMLAGQIALLTYQAGVYFATDADPARTGNAHPIIAAYQTFQVLDGYVNIAVGNDDIWRRFRDALDLPAAAHRDSWATNEGRIADLPELVAIISARLETMDTAHLVALLDAAAVPCGPTYTVPEALRQPQAAEYSLWTQVDHPTLGRLDQLGFPYHLSATPCEIRLPPPLLGLHTDDVLGEEGYTREEIAQLRADGVI